MDCVLHTWTIVVKSKCRYSINNETVSDCRWHTVVCDGHDLQVLDKTFFDAAQCKGKPTAVLAKTFKGKGFEGG